ncbi:MAG: tRNA pseudouridine synthase A [Promethearchaeota archaeon]
MTNSYHYFIKVWYDGKDFSGSQYQPDVETVDGTLIRALKELGYFGLDDTHNERFKVAGRTDKGVSALGAVYYINTLKAFHPVELNKWMLSNGHDILTWKVAFLEKYMNPRNAISRTYKYFLMDMDHDLNIENLKKGLAVFLGTHDFQWFSKKGIKEGIIKVRELSVADLFVDGDLLIFTFTSQGFLWEQVRRMVSFLLKYNDDSIEDRINTVFKSRKRPNIEPASPRGLILWDVEYGNEIIWHDVDRCQEKFIKIIKRKHEKLKLQDGQLKEIMSFIDGKKRVKNN